MIYARYGDGSLCAVSSTFNPRTMNIVLASMGDQRAVTVFDGHPADGAKVIARINLDGLPPIQEPGQ